MTHMPMQSRQRGLTLIEFMISIALGMLMVAALATLIADQSGNRNEVDKSGRLIENGRYAIRTIADDLQMAGYWGELTNMPAMPAALPDPCSATVADLTAAMPLHIQGYAPPAATATNGYNPTSNPAVTLTCLTNRRPGTDVLVVRHANPDSTDVETAGVVDSAKVTANRVYLQTGLEAVGTVFTYRLDTGSNFATTFNLLKKDKATLATLRKVVVRIYYVADCSVCTGANPDTIPTLKMLELTTGPNLSTPIAIAEGVENLQIDYGVDSDTDGAPNGADVHGNTLALADWPNVMTVRLNLLVRSPETTPGYTDGKTYSMGVVGSTDAANDGYKRHVFVQSVRLVNPSARRVL
jgi:type IV pilus assembly protein PilW